MTYSKYLYITDAGVQAYYYQWDFLAAQLNIGGPVSGLPHASDLVIPRYQIFLSSQGYRLKIIVPSIEYAVWSNITTIGWFGYLYTNYRWVGERPKQTRT